MFSETPSRLRTSWVAALSRSASSAISGDVRRVTRPGRLAGEPRAELLGFAQPRSQPRDHPRAPWPEILVGFPQQPVHPPQPQCRIIAGDRTDSSFDAPWTLAAFGALQHAVACFRVELPDEDTWGELQLILETSEELLEGDRAVPVLVAKAGSARERFEQRRGERRDAYSIARVGDRHIDVPANDDLPGSLFVRGCVEPGGNARAGSSLEGEGAIEDEQGVLHWNRG